MSAAKEVPTVGERVVFRKNGRDFLVIAESEYQGRKYIDIRSHYVKDKGDLAPTRKGITISPAILNEFAASLSAFAQELEMSGGGLVGKTEEIDE